MARLIYLMGPSGAGKDSLLAALRADAEELEFVIEVPEAGFLADFVLELVDRARGLRLTTIRWCGPGGSFKRTGAITARPQTGSADLARRCA